MIYNSIDKSLVSLAHDSQSFGAGAMTSVYYDGGNLQIAERDRYVRVDGIETNQFKKRQMMVKSKVLAQMVNDIIASIEPHVKTKITSPIMNDGHIRVSINAKTRFTKLHDRSPYSKRLDNMMFDACVSLTIPTIFTGNEKTSLQIAANEVVVTNVRDSDLDINLEQLKLAD